MKTNKHLNKKGIIQLHIQVAKRSKKSVAIPPQCWITIDANKKAVFSKVYPHPTQTQALSLTTKAKPKQTHLKKIVPLICYNIA